MTVKKVKNAFPLSSKNCMHNVSGHITIYYNIYFFYFYDFYDIKNNIIYIREIYREMGNSAYLAVIGQKAVIGEGLRVG